MKKEIMTNFNPSLYGDLWHSHHMTDSTPIKNSPTHCFRLRLRMCTHLKVPDKTEVSLALPGFPLVIAEVQGEASPGQWITFKGCEFTTEGEARMAGEQFRDCLLVMGATNAFGIDTGFDRCTLSFSQDMHDLVMKEHGRELRGEMHGLMVYKKDTIRIWGVQAHGIVSIDQNTLQEKIVPWFDKKLSLTERQRNCAALLNDSFFISSSDGQFILRVSAIEALCEQPSISAEELDVIDRLTRFLANISANDDIKASVKRTLSNAQRTSVRRACMTKCRTLLNDSQAKEFDSLYALRSDFLHDGRGRGQLSEASNKAFRLAIALLTAELCI